MTLAQSMMRGSTGAISDGHTAREEAEGKEVWEKLQAKQLECKNLTDDNFETLGEFFMGRMAGSSHEVMNTMMIQMIGEKGEEQMHVVMGKRLSGCDTSASIPANGTGFIPMTGIMSMMTGDSWGNQPGRGGGWSMMGNNFSGMMAGWGIFGFLTWFALFIFLILGIIYFWKQITKKERK